MADDAKIVVRLSLRQAKRALNNLGKMGKATADRVGDGFGGSMVKGLGLGAGMAAGVGMAKGAAKTVATSGLGDVFGEMTKGLEADVDAKIGGPEARARRTAREQVRNDWAWVVGETGNMTGAKADYATKLRFARREEEGASKINRALAGGRAEDPDGKGPLDKVMEGIVQAIQDGFTGLIGKLIGLGDK